MSSQQPGMHTNLWVERNEQITYHTKDFEYTTNAGLIRHATMLHIRNQMESLSNFSQSKTWIAEHFTHYGGKELKARINHDFRKRSNSAIS